jgi:hypothetical protein
MKKQKVEQEAPIAPSITIPKHFIEQQYNQYTLAGYAPIKLAVKNEFVTFTCCKNELTIRFTFCYSGVSTDRFELCTTDLV